MSVRRSCQECLVAVVAAGFAFFADVSSAQEHFLARGGKAEAVIVVGRENDTLCHWVAGEIKRYVKQLSGAELPVVESDELPTGKSLLVLGSPKTNPLVAAAQEKGLVDFTGLKPEGLILKTVKLEGRPAVIVGGNDEASTMYAVYALLERLGIVFQLTNDIIPQKKPDLAMPALDVRMEPVLKYRGMHCCHGLRWYMGLEDFRRHIDQLAKLKMNCLQFYFGIGGSPWLEFSYKGKKTEILYPRESGYLAWGGKNMLDTSGTANDVRVGRECFPTEYLGAPEFAHVQTQEQAYRTAREFLREVIRYAHSRKIQVWLMMGEIPRVPANMVPPDVKTPLNLFYCGRLLPGGHPDLVPIWEAAVTSLLESYPEADAIGFWCSEHSARADDPETQRMLAEYPEARKLIPALEEITRLGNTHAAGQQGSMGKSGSVLDSDFAEICVANKVVRAIKARHPDVNLMVSLLFRGYLLRAMDALMPEGVRLQNMDTFANSKPVMHFYGGMPGRELLVMPRIDHDGCELHMQLNITQYDEDEIISGSAKYGVAGIVGQLNKERGLEV
ncbi:MAG: alpha-glucuronidase family glycosyl hydrolase, partial [Acidobacteriota bacterium]